MIAHLLKQSAAVKRFPIVIDEYGNESRGTATTITYPCRLEQTDGTEVTVNRNTQTSNWNLFLLPEADIKSGDQVVVDATTFEVAGPPAKQQTPRGAHHIEARLVHVD